MKEAKALLRPEGEMMGILWEGAMMVLGIAGVVLRGGMMVLGVMLRGKMGMGGMAGVLIPCQGAGPVSDPQSWRLAPQKRPYSML